jgi:hypothetical protein
VADDDLRPALSNLVRATGDVGKAQKLAGCRSPTTTSDLSYALIDGAPTQVWTVGPAQVDASAALDDLVLVTAPQVT